jgi:hypothetical protein
MWSPTASPRGALRKSQAGAIAQPADKSAPGDLATWIESNISQTTVGPLRTVPQLSPDVTIVICGANDIASRVAVGHEGMVRLVEVQDALRE